MLSIRNMSYLLPLCCSFWEKCKNSPKTDLGCSTPLKVFCLILNQIWHVSQFKKLYVWVVFSLKLPSAKRSYLLLRLFLVSFLKILFLIHKKVWKYNTKRNLGDRCEFTTQSLINYMHVHQCQTWLKTSKLFFLKCPNIQIGPFGYEPSKLYFLNIYRTLQKMIFKTIEESLQI